MEPKNNDLFLLLANKNMVVGIGNLQWHKNSSLPYSTNHPEADD
jgi:hypothetical protein